MRRAAHGTRTRYQSGCRCEPCRAEHNRYMAVWRRRRLDNGWRILHGYFSPPRPPEAPQ